MFFGKTMKILDAQKQDPGKNVGKDMREKAIDSSIFTPLAALNGMGVPAMFILPDMLNLQTAMQRVAEKNKSIKNSS
jgi:hypothetical protein